MHQESSAPCVFQQPASAPSCGYPVASTVLDYQVYFNGTYLGAMSRRYGLDTMELNQTEPVTKTFDVDIADVHFAARNPGSVPTPGTNTVQIVGDEGQLRAIFDQDQDVTEFGSVFGKLEFSSMAPVVLVHGWNSGPWWWGPSPCKQDSRDHVNFDFIQALQAADAPFTCSFPIPQNASISAGADQLAVELTGVAAEFGTNHVHLVGHSKGGLWIRKALPRLADSSLANDSNIGVYSVTTLSTPNQGSSLADLLVLAHEHPLLILANPRLALGLLQRSYAGAEDLQTTTGDLIGPPPNQFTVIDQDIGSTAT